MEMDLVRLAKKLLKRKTRKGRLNILIDELFHSKFPDPYYVMLDTSMHYLVEKDTPKEFWRKFIKYNLKYLMPEENKNVEAQINDAKHHNFKIFIPMKWRSM